MAGSVFFGGFGQASVANGCPPTWTPSAVVPGLCWAGPATTPAIVKAAVDGAVPEIRGPFVAFARKQRTPAEADAFLVAWANGAFNAWKAADALGGRLASEASGTWWSATWRNALTGGAIPGLLAGQGLDYFVDRYRRQVRDWRASWDQRSPSLQALRAHLAALDADQPVPLPVALEVARLAVHYAGAAWNIGRVSRDEYARPMFAIFSGRVEANSFTGRFTEGLSEIAGAAGAAIREAVRIAATSVLAPFVGALVPRWVWVALIGVGGLVVYGVVSGNPLVGAARRALRRG